MPVERARKAGIYASLFTVFLWLIMAAGVGTAKAETTADSLHLNVKAAVLIEAETGQILYSMNADQLRHPASMVKMMTEYIVAESIAEGKLRWEDEVTITEYAQAMPGSGIPLAAGHVYTVRDLFRQMSINSSNDATVALAEAVAGTEEKFVHLMNEKAREFGLSEGAMFTNSTGLNKEDTGKYSPNIPGESMFTALDAAKLAQRIILDHPEVLEFTSTPRATERENDPNSHVMDNWNWMLENWKEYNNNFSRDFAYDGLDGLKTGHTDEAGWCFTGTAVRNGVRLISVVMGAETERGRFEETRKLLDYGFNNFEKQVIVPAKSTVDSLPEVEIKKGKSKRVKIVTEKGIELIVKKGTDLSLFTLEATPVDEEQRIAPIEKNQKLGVATLKYAGTDQQFGNIEVSLVAAEDVEKAGWFTLLLRGIGEFFKNLFESIKNLF